MGTGKENIIKVLSKKFVKFLVWRSFIFPLGIFLVLFSFNTLAQSGRFVATVNKSKISLGATFEITFTLENADAQNFKPPVFNDFQVLSGPNQSTSMQIINGNVTRSVSYSYYLRPKAEGKFTIPPASATVAGKTIESNSLTVEVVKGNVQDQQGQDIYSEISDGVFIRLIVDKKEVYQGEQVTAMYKLYYRLPISNTSISKAPTYTGFWSQELEMPENIQFTPEVYNGVQYNAAVIKKDALFPQRSGELEIDAIELQTAVRIRVRQQRSFFDDFFGAYQDHPYKFGSNSVKINVKPLPAGAPASFDGAVGEYQMDVTLDKTETNPDEPVTLKIQIAGTGNIKMLDLPEIDLPADLDVFDPKVSEKIIKRNNTISGSKTSEYLIIPRRGGNFKIPPVEFIYFDLEKRQYVVQQSPEFIINVEGTGATVTQPTISGVTKEEVELLGQDIRYIKMTGVDFTKKGDFLFNSMRFGALYAAPFFILLLLFAYKKREEKIAGNVALRRGRGANKEATKRLKNAKKFLANNERKAFFDEITRAIWGFLGDKLNIDQAALSREQAAAAMNERNVSAETAQKIFATLDEAEMALFAPASDGEMQKVYNDANEAISKLDAEMKK